MMRVLSALYLAGLMLTAPVAAQEAVNSGSGAIVRGLDKVSGKVTDLEIVTGQWEGLGRMEVALEECRYPEGNPSGDAYAFLTIREVGNPDPVFRGWMIASAPALNAMDHSRYDIWVLRCQTS